MDRALPTRDVPSAQLGTVRLLGSIKWRARKPISSAEASALMDGRAVVAMAAGARLLAVCPAGARDDADVDVVLGAADLIAAFDRPWVPACGPLHDASGMSTR